MGRSSLRPAYASAQFSYDIRTAANRTVVVVLYPLRDRPRITAFFVTVTKDVAQPE